MSRKRDWRWVSRESRDEDVIVWAGRRPPERTRARFAGWIFEAKGRYSSVDAADFASLGARIRPGECRRVRIKLEVLPDD